MAIKESSKARIARELGNDISAWQLFGVYEYAWPCQTCACGHQIANVFVLIRKGDHGPAFGEQVNIGTECIKYVRDLSPDLYTWMMTAKAEMDRIKRQERIKRVDALHATPEYRALYNQLDAFVDMAAIVSNAASFSTYGHPLYVARCTKAGIGITPEAYSVFGTVGRLAAYIRKNVSKFDLLANVQHLADQAEKLLPELRTAAEPGKSLLTTEFSGKSKYMPNYTGVSKLFQF